MNLGIYCAGGLGKEVYDVAFRENTKTKRWESIFFIDDNKENNSNCYLSRVYTLSYIQESKLINDLEVVIASGEPPIRVKIRQRLVENGIKLGKVVDPSATISPTAKLADGVIVTSDCIVASSAIVGENVLINVKSIVGHDITIENDVVISSMVNIGGACKIGARTMLGMGCLIKQLLEIGEDVIISMGSVVHHNIPPRVIALGNPARPMRENILKTI
jgi:sugar O-acyltransferase (sialic acid O-acetyltransferase NeuD family)